MDSLICDACGGENPAGMRFCGHCATPLAPAEAVDPTRLAETVREAAREHLRSRAVARHLQDTQSAAEERRLVTALFADVSGFTALADTLEPDELVEAIDPVINALSEVVAAYEGFISKFAGDALLCLFGAPVAHEDDAERALLAALDMMGRMERIRPELLPVAQHLGIHIGVNTGHAAGRLVGADVQMLFDVLGDAVNLAQRLESQAPVGQIYVGETTVKLAERRFEFEQVGDLTLKGKATPVPAWRLIGEREGPRHARWATAGRKQVPLVGRDDELASSDRVLSRLREGRGSLITVAGEQGVGKTRLLAEIERHARSRYSMRWMATRCPSYGSGLAYWPYTELVRSAIGIERTEAAEAASASLATSLRRLGVSSTLPYLARMMGLPAPEGCEDVSDLEPEAFRRELHRSVVEWVGALARQGRVVIALEDYHWADASSVQLTKHLSRSLAGTPIAVVVTARPEGISALEDVEVDAPEEARCAIRLERLGREATSALVRAILAGEAPAEVTAIVEERASGNPFFVEELLRSLQETGALFTQDGTWQLRRGWDGAALPATVEGVLAARIDLLPPDVTNVLQVGSVIGRRIPVPLLRETLGGPPNLDAKLDRLVESGLLDPIAADGDGAADATGVLIFHHALVQDVAYARLLRRRKRELHLKVAEAGQRLYGSGDDVLDLLARHLYLGGAGLEAVDVLVRAGDRARRLFANEEAILHFEHALEVARVDGARWPEIAVGLADLYQLSGRYDDALKSFAEVREANNDIRAWCGATAALRVRGEYQQALDLVGQRLASGEFAGLELSRLLLEQGMVLAASGHYQDAIDTLQAGLDAAGTRKDPAVGLLLLSLARSETVVRKLEDALEHARLAQSIFAEHADFRGTARAYREMAATYHLMGRLGDAADALRKGLELAQRIGSVEEMGACLINLGFVEMDRGAIEEAIACDRRAIEQFERVGGGGGRAIGYGNLADKLLVAGNLEEAEKVGAKAIEIAQSIGHTHTIADVTRTLATIRLRQSRYAEAISYAEEAASVFTTMGLALEASETLKLAAEALDCLGEAERAREIRSRARSLSDA